MEEDTYQSTNCSISRKLKNSHVTKNPKEVINMPNFTTPVQSINNPSMETIKRGMMQQINKDILFYPDPIYQPPSKPVEIPMSKLPENMDINPELNTDFEENSLFQEGVIYESYQRPDKLFFWEPQELDSFVNTGRIVEKFLLKEADIDKILKVTVQRKVLKYYSYNIREFIQLCKVITENQLNQWEDMVSTQSDSQMMIPSKMPQMKIPDENSDKMSKQHH